MSWFEYGTLPANKRKLRKGVWLRVRSLPEPLLKEAKKLLSWRETIEWVEVKEIRPEGRVFLQFWCRKIGFLKPEKPTVFKVFGFDVPEDPTWICEGDLGRGYKS